MSILPPPRGELNPGTSLTFADPLNSDCRLPLQEDAVRTHRKQGFTAARSRLQSAEYGLWAKFVRLTGIGGELSYGWEPSDEDVYRFEQLEEVSITPRPNYIRCIMVEPNVRDFVEDSGYQPVCTITGLKIARGPSVEHRRGGKRKITAEGGGPSANCR